jgi:hypothetical protein
LWWIDRESDPPTRHHKRQTNKQLFAPHHAPALSHSRRTHGSDEE